MPNNPKAYIVYSHDSDEFKDWVRKFTDKLIKMGIDTKLDQYDLLLTDHIPEFMEKGIADSDFVIFLITHGFIQKCNQRKGGIGYEIKLSTGEIFVKGKGHKFIPILIKVAYEEVPPFFLGEKAVRITDLNNYEKEFIELYAYLTNQKLLEKPSLGKIVRIEELKKGEDLFDIEELRKRARMRDYVLWKLRIMDRCFKEDEFAYIFPRYRECFLSKYQAEFNSTCFYPHVLHPNNQKLEGTKIVYESKNFSPVSNLQCYDKIVFSGNKIEYSFIELMEHEPRMVLVNTRFPLLSFFYLMVMLSKCHSKEGLPIALSVNLDLTTSTRGVYSFFNPLFKVKYSVTDEYILMNSHFACSADFKDVERKTMMKFFQKILGAFISSNNRSRQPFFEIEEKDFDMVYDSIMRGEYQY
jgi:hypothetical protein